MSRVFTRIGILILAFFFLAISASAKNKKTKVVKVEPYYKVVMRHTIPDPIPSVAVDLFFLSHLLGEQGHVAEEGKVLKQTVQRFPNLYLPAITLDIWLEENGTPEQRVSLWDQYTWTRYGSQNMLAIWFTGRINEQAGHMYKALMNYQLVLSHPERYFWLNQVQRILLVDDFHRIMFKKGLSHSPPMFELPILIYASLFPKIENAPPKAWEGGELFSPALPNNKGTSDSLQSPALPSTDTSSDCSL